MLALGQNPPLTVTFRFNDYRCSASACPDAAALTGADAVSVPGGLILKVTTVLQWA
jgi:hypothetical protein